VWQVEGELSNVVALEKGSDYGILTGDCLGNLEMILREVRSHEQQSHTLSSYTPLST
jgi:hypothetical protein